MILFFIITHYRNSNPNDPDFSGKFCYWYSSSVQQII